MIIYLQMLENSCVEMEHAGKNERSKRECEGLQRFHFHIAGWAGDILLFHALFSGNYCSFFFSPQNWEREGKDTQSVKKGRWKKPLTGMQITVWYKSPSVVQNGNSEPQDCKGVGGVQDFPAKDWERRYRSIFPQKEHTWERDCFHKGKQKGWKADLETGYNTHNGEHARELMTALGMVSIWPNNLQEWISWEHPIKSPQCFQLILRYIPWL